jgi:tetratricopeptide (TPR) repeat protein
MPRKSPPDHPARPALQSDVECNVTSIADRIRRRNNLRALEEAQRGLAERTWAAESRAEMAEHVVVIENLGLDDPLPKGADTDACAARATLLCARGNRAHLRGDDETAFAEWAKAIVAAPGAADAYILRGAIRSARGETELALADLDRATELAPNDVSAFYRRGQLFARMGDHERALANYRRGVQINPTLISNLMAMADSFMALDDASGALGAVDRAIRAAPHFADLFLRRAMCHARLGNLVAALHDYDRSLEINPKQGMALRLRADVHRDLGRHDRAVADLTRACELEPDAGGGRIALGLARLAADPHGATVAELTELIELCPDSDVFYALRARAHRKAKDFVAAVADFETAIRLDPTFVHHVVGLAEVRCDMDGPEASLFYLDRVIALRPLDATLWTARARVRNSAGKLDEAVASFDTAISVEPDSAQLHQERATVLYKLGRYERAAAGMTRAIELEPSNGLHHAWRGYCRTPLDDPREEVAADFARAIDLAPESVVPWFFRAQFLEGEERWSEAIADLDRAVAIEPTWGVIYFRRGTCRQGLAIKISDEAADEEEEATDEADRQSNNLIRAAIVDLERCLELGTKHFDVHMELWAAHGNFGDQAGMLAALDGAIELNPSAAWPYYHRSGLRRTRGDDEGARRDMAEALAHGYVTRDEREMQWLRDYARAALDLPAAPRVCLSEGDET